VYKVSKLRLKLSKLWDDPFKSVLVKIRAMGDQNHLGWNFQKALFQRDQLCPSMKNLVMVKKKLKVELMTYLF